MSIRIAANYPDNNSSQSIKLLKTHKLQEQGRAIVQHKEPQSLAVNGLFYSMFSLIKIPEELRSTISSHVYINNNLSPKLSTAMPVNKNKQAGFYLETMDAFPSGQYQLNIVSIFSDKPFFYEKADYINNLVDNEILILTRELQKDSLARN